MGLKFCGQQEVLVHDMNNCLGCKVRVGEILLQVLKEAAKTKKKKGEARISSSY